MAEWFTLHLVMAPFLFILGGFGLMVLSYLLMTFYMRRRNGVQPNYVGLLIMGISMGCFLAAFYILQRSGIDVQHGKPRDVFWIVLGIVWLTLAVWTAYQRQVSGTVLMDLGPAPMFKVQIALAVLLAAMAIGVALSPESRTQAFAYITWSLWFLVMALGRFEVRDRGVVIGSLVRWSRIAGCVATGDNMVRLDLTKGLRRSVDIKVPTERRDEFIRLISGRNGATVAPG